MNLYEPFLFHKTYPLDSFFEETKLMEKEKELMLSYLPEEYREIQRKVEETCDRMEYEGSRMYDEYPDRGVIRQLVKKICMQMKNGDIGKEQKEEKFVKKELTGCSGADRYQEDIVCCFLCNEMFRRRYRFWKSKKYIK